jgi:ABC-type Fe3+/spermidine/putrescine transport system ATPase subunit
MMLTVKTTFIRGKPIEFTAYKGERWWIQGETGCGKTTFFHRLSGLEQASLRDSFMWQHKSLIGLPPQKRPISYLLQNQPLFEMLTLKQQIKLSLNPEKFENLVREYLPHINLKQLGHTLSGGEKRVVGLLRMIIEEREIILLDEPFVGLDSDLKEKMFKLFVDYQRTTPSIILYTCHEKESSYSFYTNILY